MTAELWSHKNNSLSRLTQGTFIKKCFKILDEKLETSPLEFGTFGPVRLSFSQKKTLKGAILKTVRGA